MQKFNLKQLNVVETTMEEQVKTQGGYAPKNDEPSTGGPIIVVNPFDPTCW